MVPCPAQRIFVPSPFEHNSARKAPRLEEPEVADTRRRIPCQWPGCFQVLLSSEDQAAHGALHYNDRSSSDSALLASENNKRPRLRGDPEDTFSFGKKRQCLSHYDVHSSGGSSSIKTAPSASTKTLRAKPSVRCPSSRRPTPKTDDSDMDPVVQHKVKEGKVAHKRAEQKRRSELSSLIAEMEQRLPSQFLTGCQPRNQKPRYTKNGTLKAVLNYHKHQVTVIEEQDKIIEAQAAANAALKEKIAALMQQAQQCGTWNGPPG